MKAYSYHVIFVEARSDTWMVSQLHIFGHKSVRGAF